MPYFLQKWLYQLIFSAAMYKSPGCSTSSWTFIIVCHFYYRHLSGYEVVLDYCFDLYLSNANDVWHLFLCLLAIHICLMKFPLRHFAHLKIVCFCLSSLYILDTSPSEIWFLHIFFYQSVACLFRSQKFWCINLFLCLCFYYHFLTEGHRFSFRSFIVLDFIFGSVIHFDFCIWFEILIKVFFKFLCAYVLAPFEKAILYPLNCLCTFVKN